MGEVGRSQVRVDAYDKATGRTKYYEDQMPQDALYVRIKHAEIAHGFVKSVDTSAAEAIDGVVKVLTCFDVPDITFPTAGHPWSMDPGHQDVADRHLLNQHVRHALFFVFFFGAPCWVLLSLLPAWRHWRNAWWRCLAAAGLLYALGIIVFTAQVNLPNNAYTESWHPQHLPSDWAATRDTWRLANHWRTAVSGLSFVLACVALAIRPAPVAVPAVTSLPSRA